jgi:hypothetical protein
MRHATAQDLDRIEPLLEQVRALGVLKEKTRGCFYLKSRGFLHFHADPAGLFADIGDDRVRVDEPAGAAAVLARIAALRSPSKSV